MKCKNCGSPMEEGQTVCPFCDEEVTTKPLKEKKPFKWTKKMTITTSISVVSVILVVVMLLGIVELGLVKVFWKDNNIQYKEKYNAGFTWSNMVRDQKVVTMGDYSLTNSQLQVFFWMQLYEILDYYGNYAEYYLGIDLSIPLSEQEYNKTGKTWEQYILEEALNSWHRYQATVAMAEKANYKMPADYQEDFKNLRTNLETTAKEQGFASADAMIVDQFGEGVTFDDYYHYLYVRYVAELYFSEVISELKFTDAELDQFYQDNKEELEGYGVKQDGSLLVDFRNILVKPVTSKDENGKTIITDEAWADCLKKAQDILDNWLNGKADETSFTSLAKIKSEDTNTSSNGGLNQYVGKNDWATVDIRHILIMPEGGTKDASGNITYSEAEWEACRAAAQALLDEYLAGEQTEEKFGELANTHSDDNNGAVTNGGLYTDVTPGRMVAAFDEWIFTEGRQHGETGLVKTEYGYHVMYFVDREGSVDDWAFAEGRKGGDYELIKTEAGYQIIYYVTNHIEWEVWCEEGLMSETSMHLMDTYTEQNPMDVKYWAILFSDNQIETT